MNRKIIALSASIMAAVFLIIVIVYPLIFSPNTKPTVNAPGK